ncbi:hypothetical protein [Actinophytocola sp.]|uniref:Zn-ribbon domain-containing OB-fold protein n=1 Tax=Actinophytocola sp. TaxID=1872138 RepID=UPI003D6C185C
MTIGIELAGAYVPRYRLEPTLAQALGCPSDIPLHAPDEDALTLLWTALEQLTDHAASSGPLILRSPAGELEPRALVAYLAVAGRLTEPRSVLAMSPQTGAAGVIRAAAGHGSAIAALADQERPADLTAAPSSDCSIALRFGAPRAAEVLGVASLAVLSFDRWARMAADGPPDTRFVEETLVAGDGAELLGQLLAGARVASGQLVGVVVSAAVGIRHHRLAKQWQVPRVWSPLGVERTAGRLAGATLLAAFERLREAGPGALLAVLELGWGGDGLLLRAGPEIGTAVRTLADPPCGSYDYRRWLRAGADTPDTWTSPAKLRRETGNLLGLAARRCASCRVVTFPVNESCEGCGSTDTSAFTLARRGTVVSHNLDRLFAAPEEVQMVVVDLDGGGRFFGQLVADTSRWVVVGDRVRLALRLLHRGAGMPHYFWKVELDD